jgi:hypothetical protein
MLALAGVVWMLLVQVLGGSTTLVHAHGSEGGHVHLVATEVRASEHDEWHRRAHGAEANGEDAAKLEDDAPHIGERAPELLLQFPSAPQIAQDDSGAEGAVALRFARVALSTPWTESSARRVTSKVPESRARSPVRRLPPENLNLSLRI